MSNRGDFVGTAPNSGNYIPAPVPANKEDLPVYVNDELLRLGGTVNGVLEGGALPPHSKLPKRYKEGMIMNFSEAVGDGVDSSGVWLYKKAKWWKLIDDPTAITEEIYEEIGKIEAEIDLVDEELIKLNADLDNLNDVELPALQANLDNLNNVELPAVQDELTRVEGELTTLNDTTIPSINDELSQLDTDLSTLDNKFPIGTTDISDDAISTPKLQANSVHADKIIANAISADKIAANAVTTAKLKALSVTADKIVANAITADKIAANTITGDKIRANTINGDRIIANTINGDRIIANTINGDNIIANTIGADKLVANSITGGKISSATTIRAGSGNQSAYLDGADSTWRLYAGSSTPASAPFRVDKDGNLYANSGTFGGKVYAQMVEGDFTDTVTKKFDTNNKISWTSSSGNPGYVTPIDLFNLKIRYPKPYKRIVRIDPIRFDMDSGGGSQWYHMIVHKQYLNPVTGVPEGPEQGIVGSYDAAWAVYDDGQRKFNSSPVVHFEVPINEAAQYRISIGVESNTTGGGTRRQVVSCSLFKQGTELSFV